MSIEGFLICFKSKCLEPAWLIIRSNRFFATGKKFLSNDVDPAIITNFEIEKLWKMMDDMLLVTDCILIIQKLTISNRNIHIYESCMTTIMLHF